MRAMISSRSLRERCDRSSSHSMGTARVWIVAYALQHGFAHVVARLEPETRQDTIGECSGTLLFDGAENTGEIPRNRIVLRPPKDEGWRRHGDPDCASCAFSAAISSLSVGTRTAFLVTRSATSNPSPG